MPFPTTIWTTIKKAGANDPQARERFAGRYHAPVLRFIRRKGFSVHEADDICQDVFVRIFAGNALARADASKGRFRSLVLAITTHVIQDRFRRRRPLPVSTLEPAARDAEFDKEWILSLAQRAMRRLQDQGSRYFPVLRDHLNGKSQNRNKLWIARKKLTALIRDEIAHTCRTHEEFEEEVAYLARYLRPPAQKTRPNK